MHSSGSGLGVHFLLLSRIIHLPQSVLPGFQPACLPPPGLLPVLFLFSSLCLLLSQLLVLPAVSSIGPSSWTQILFIPRIQVYVKSNSPCILSTACVNETFCLLLTRKPPWIFIILHNLLKLIKKYVFP